MTNRSKAVWWFIIVLVLVVAASLSHEVLAGVWKSLGPVKQEHIASGLISIAAGIVTSFFASYLFNKLQQDNVNKIIKKLSEILSQHELLLNNLVPAIGGSFTRSLFAFHPMASEEIARILSVETNRLYGRHHKRVIVTSAKDSYAIKGLKHFDKVVVWSLEFHAAWQWKNDSKITKYPLEDFLLVAAANDEALDDFSPEHESDV
jgi:hypothetical protein